MLPTAIHCALFFLLPGFALAQQLPPTPPVKVNVLNVCSPSADEQKQIAAALERVPAQPSFTIDFEVARGRSSMPDRSEALQGSWDRGAVASQPILAAWVRIRREFSPQTALSNVQYSFSTDAKAMIETLVMHVRDPKDLIQLSIEDNASSVTSPASMLATRTPADRIRLERLGKPSIVLARCRGSADSPPPDQSAYEPLFQQASSILGHYRDLLEAPRQVPEELAKVLGFGQAQRNAKSKPRPRPADARGK